MLLGPDMQLEDVLHEFDAVVQELGSPSRSSGSSCGHLLLLQEGRRCSGSIADSGVEDSDYSEYRGASHHHTDNTCAKDA